MTSADRRHLTWALLASLLLHVSLLGAPDWLWWRVPTLDDPQHPESSQLDAQLIAPSVRKASPPPVRPPPPRRRKSVPVPRVLAQDSPAPTSITVAPLSAPVQAAPPAPAGVAETPLAEPTEGVAVSPTAQQPEPALPRRGSIRFVISRGDRGFIIGQSLHRWSHDDQSYTLSSVTETTGIAAVFRPARVLQSSEGEIGVAGLRPSKFRTEKNGIAGDAAAFDWTGMSLRLVPGGGIQRAEPLVTGAQDMLSMFYQFSALYPRMPREFNEIMVATGRKFERYAFSVLREEILETKLGAMRTLHLRTAAGVEAIDIWMGLDLRGLPLKIRYTDREGESYDQVADEIEFEGKQNPAGSQ